MDTSSALSLALPIGLGLAAIGSGIGFQGAIGRQPEASGKIQTAMIIGAGLIEALTIYAFVTVFLLKGKIQ